MASGETGSNEWVDEPVFALLTPAWPLYILPQTPITPFSDILDTHHLIKLSAHI